MGYEEKNMKHLITWYVNIWEYKTRHDWVGNVID